MHFEESENREVSPPEGETKSSSTGDSDTPFMNNEDDTGSNQVAESKIQEAKDDEEGKELMVIPKYQTAQPLASYSSSNKTCYLRSILLKMQYPPGT